MSDEQVVLAEGRPQTESLVSLHDQLDVLWIRYLTLLDEYTNAQAAIKKHMSAGFFTLAQANFKSSRGRYGQDYYDERAVATTGVQIAARDETISCKIVKKTITTETESVGHAASEPFAENEKNSVADPAKAKPTQLPSPESTPEPESPATSKTDTKTDTNSDHEPPKPQINAHDPVRWFGILVPATLRQAQKSFSTAVLDEATVTKAINSSRGMREVEAEIRKLRKAIKKEEKKGIAMSSVGNAVRAVS